MKRVLQLVESGANVNAVDSRGNSALMEAAFFKYPKLVKALLEKGADPTIINKAGDTALSEAIRVGGYRYCKVAFDQILPR